MIALSTALIVIVLNEVASHKALINVSICVEVNEPLLMLSNPPDNPWIASIIPQIASISFSPLITSFQFVLVKSVFDIWYSVSAGSP